MVDQIPVAAKRASKMVAAKVASKAGSSAADWAGVCRTVGCALGIADGYARGCQMWVTDKGCSVNCRSLYGSPKWLLKFDGCLNGTGDGCLQS